MVRKGGSKTKGGMYWKKGEWEIVTVERTNGTLPGTDEDEYLRIPGILFAPLALVLGLGFYLFLPFIGFAMVVSLIGKKIWGRPGHVSPKSAPPRLNPTMTGRKIWGEHTHTRRAEGAL